MLALFSHRAAALATLAALAGACADNSPISPLAPRGARADGVPGSCQVTTLANDGGGSLRAAATSASCTAVTFARGLTGTIALAAPAIVLDHNITIAGPGADKVKLTIAPQNLTRIFEVQPNVVATISGFTVADVAYPGTPGGYVGQPCDNLAEYSTMFTAGVVCNLGTLTLADMRFSNLDVSASDGIGTAAIVSRGTSLTLLRSELQGNVGFDIVQITAGALRVSQTTFVGNQSFLGTLHVKTTGSGLIENSTFTGNAASLSGGAINPSGQGPLTVRYTTIAGNVSLDAITSGIDAAFRYYSADAPSFPVYIEASVIAGNTSSTPGWGDLSPDPSGGDPTRKPYVSLGYNIIGVVDASTAVFFDQPGDVVGVVDPQVGTLADNGGPTRTMALLPTSPGVNAIPLNASACGTQVTTDQRGAVRPKNGACDVGAFESGYANYQFSGFTSPLSSTMLNSVKAGQAVPLKWRILDANGQPVTNLTTASISSTSIPCPNGEAMVTVTTATTTTNSSLQNFGNGYYQLNWKTDNSWVGSCRRLELDLGELSPRTADFQFK